MCGSDWRQYEPAYEILDIHNLSSTYFWEPGYGIWMAIFKFIGFRFWPFFILTKVICFSVIANSIDKGGKNDKYLIWMFFLPLVGFFLFIDNPMRNLIAVTIFIWAIRYIQRGFFIKYLICSLIALSFHLTAIIFIPLYFILRCQWKNKVWIILIVFFWLLFVNPNIVTQIIVKFTGVSVFAASKIQSYFIGDSEYSSGSFLSTGMMITIFFTVLILKYRKITDNQNIMYLNAALFYVVLYRLGMSISIFYRFQLYVIIFYCIAVVKSLMVLQIRSRKIVIWGLFLFSCFLTKNISSIPKYAPYTNIIPYYINNDMRSFEERAAYNKIDEQVTKE